MRIRLVPRRRRAAAVAALLVTGALAAAFALAHDGERSLDASLDYWARRYDVDPRLVRAVAWVESRNDPAARSSADARGVMQVQPATWLHTERLLGTRVPATTDGNIRIGVAYLREELIRDFGDTREALIAYNQGPTALRRDGPYPAAIAYADAVYALAYRR